MRWPPNEEDAAEGFDGSLKVWGSCDACFDGFGLREVDPLMKCVE